MSGGNAGRDWEPPRDNERECEVKDVSEPRRRSLDERFGCDPSELREVVEDEAVELSCESPLESFGGREGMENGAGEGGRRSVIPSLCSELSVGIWVPK